LVTIREEASIPGHDLRHRQHSHDFGTLAERRTRWVVALTFAAMLLEIVAGLDHVTIEINHCRDQRCHPAA
jgi:Co/Zn/Cd efflux system component